MSPIPPPPPPQRQLHLDFHTSPLVRHVARDFDADQFAAALKQAGVQSVTCFSRCHHGMIYHDTRFAELRHPHLARDLLGEQIEACQRLGLRVPIYITVGWDDHQARHSPHWLERDEQGRHRGPALDQPGFDRKLCLNSEYVEFVHQQTAEVLERFPCDGFFFDIVYQGACCCARCTEQMAHQGLDPRQPQQRQRFAEGVLDRFKARLSGLVRGKAPAASIFYNAGHLGPETRRTLDQVTHLELESLPTGHWGYLHFPVTVRHARTFGLPLVGLTSTFHTSWGDFGSFKSSAALEQECRAMLAHGASCSVGHQLHPLGRLERFHSQRLGALFLQLEAREPWCVGAEPVVEIGVFHPEAFGAADAALDTAAAGACLILEQGGHQFDFIDGAADLSRYRLIIVPDRIRVGPELARSLERYLAGGGALLASQLGCLRPQDDDFALAQFGAMGAGPSPHEPDYLVPGPELRQGPHALPDTPLVMYERAMRARPLPGTRVLASVKRPLFNRQGQHYCSHQHAPPGDDAGYPAALRNGQVIYLAHAVFDIYRRRGAPWVRDLVLTAVDLLLPDPLVRCGGPNTRRVTLTRQQDPRRAVVHLLHYVAQSNGQAFPTVDQVIELHQVPLAVRVHDPPTRAYLAPGGQALPFACRGQYIELTVPRVEGHAMVVLEDARV